MLLLFDVDGTLVDSGKIITQDIGNILTQIKSKGDSCQFGLVGGSTYEKIKYQLADFFYLFDYVFPECGSTGYYNDKILYKKNFMDAVDKVALNKIIKEYLVQITQYDIIHAGHIIDRRAGMYYLSPVGMQADDSERNNFIKMDQKYNIRKNLISKLKAVDINDNFNVVLGGNTGLALQLKGWDKSQILEFLSDTDIIFFGDRTDPDGNDYPLFNHPKVKGYSVKNYLDTMDKLKNILKN